MCYLEEMKRSLLNKIGKKYILSQKKAILYQIVAMSSKQKSNMDQITMKNI